MPAQRPADPAWTALLLLHFQLPSASGLQLRQRRQLPYLPLQLQPGLRQVCQQCRRDSGRGSCPLGQFRLA